ncbi:hypothetical protein P154DRAFT_527070 [Amniculicola lignicola CBS 123094]|uniref:Uncharacterized protein n=1 Tax=Amniculicola lignicola CBS 123094 TaxID=1392246 RepID=A0A6A5W0J6_9PLEO|nr:hypothetical protein P154DRAFT_527070 [Amniculicola lignicola CBS 123094]
MSSPTSPSITPRQPDSFFFESSPPTLEATANSPLFKIPLEVRDQIYHYLWTGAEIEQKEEPCPFTIEYPGSEADCYYWERPRCLRASKLVLAEGIGQFYRNARCRAWRNNYHYWDYDWEISPYRLMSICRVRYLGEEIMHPTLIEPIIRSEAGIFYTARQHIYEDYRFRDEDYDEEKCIEVDNVARYVPVDTFGDASTWLTLVPDFCGQALEWTCSGGEFSYSPIDILFDRFREESHSLRGVTLKFRLPHKPKDEVLIENEFIHGLFNEEKIVAVDKRKCIVDFSYLENFGTGLECVVFGLQTSYEAGDEWGRKILILAQEELERVAKHLVGGSNGHSWALKDWVVEDDDIDRDLLEWGRYEPENSTWYVEVMRIAGTHSRGTVQCKGFTPPTRPEWVHPEFLGVYESMERERLAALSI